MNMASFNPQNVPDWSTNKVYFLTMCPNVIDSVKPVLLYQFEVNDFPRTSHRLNRDDCIVTVLATMDMPPVADLPKRRPLRPEIEGAVMLPRLSARPGIQRPLRPEFNRIMGRIERDGLWLVVLADLVPFPVYPGNIPCFRRPPTLTADGKETRITNAMNSAVNIP